MFRLFLIYAFYILAPISAPNQGNLNIPRSVDTFGEEEEIDLVAVRVECLTLQKDMSELESEMAGDNEVEL